MALDQNYKAYIESCKEHVQTAFSVGKMLIKYVYIFNKYQDVERKWGVIIAFKVNNTTEVKLGWALCNPKDRFNKYAGISKALARIGTPPTREDLSYDWEEMITRAKIYFKDGTIADNQHMKA